MLRERITPNSKEHWLELRSNDLTSTEISALFGINPYMTEFELYHNKKNKTIVTIEPNDRMKWGSRLEGAIAQGIAEDLNLTVERVSDYIHIPELKIGSSFDYFCSDDSILEIKNVDFLQYRDKWIDDGETIEAPLHIELQVQHQLLVSGKKEALICALIGGNSISVIKRMANADVHNSILAKAKKFWQDIAEGNAPNPDFNRDAKYVIDMFQSVKDDKTIEANELISELVLQYNSAASVEKQASQKKEEYKARILQEIGDAEKVKGATFSISAGTVAATQVSFERKAYRNFRITNKKGKQDDNN